MIKKTLTVKKTVSGKSFRLLDFQAQDEKFAGGAEDEDGSGEEENGGGGGGGGSDDDGNYSRAPYRPLQFIVQMFGLNELGETCCIFIKDFSPFFYVKVAQNWRQHNVDIFLGELRSKLEKYNEKYLISAELVEYNKLYGFAGGQKTKFVKLTFANMMTFNRIKNLWYYFPKGSKERKLKPLTSQNVMLSLYESKIPPLLRYFHIHNISPSGWVFLPTKKMIVPAEPSTSCKYEYICDCKDLIPQPKKETRTPYKICSFDIEASSSHGDFPVPIKSYKRLATNIMDAYIKQTSVTALKNDPLLAFIKKCVMAGFGFDKFRGIDLVYPKSPPTKVELTRMIDELLRYTGSVETPNERKQQLLTIESMFEKIRDTVNAGGGEEGGDGGDGNAGDGNAGGDEELDTPRPFPKRREYTETKKETTNRTIKDIFGDTELSRDQKIQQINEILVWCLPELEGDKVTFIGSTFIRYGEPEPYLNHCVVLDTCDPVANATIESVGTEYELLLKWTELIQRENPDIIIGYNIFGFDYEFMFRRSQENGCERSFLGLSRKQGEVSGNFNRMTQEYTLDNTKIVLATGEYDLKYPKMSGRVQIDLYAYFRRDFNLSSYKLDDVAGEFIGDSITRFQLHEDREETWLYTNNIMGLHVGDYIHIELSLFTTDYYKDGTKFPVAEIRKEDGANIIVIAGVESDLEKNAKHIKWCMAKDDVTPQDIFRLTNGGAGDRAKVAKYCIQDCNLVHHLFNKLDVITGYIEMSRICSVPISYLVLRGQGIKLTSFVAKKCRDKNTLMPDIEKKGTDDGYEGAIVLPPKCAMYMDNPVACVDYSSLYPSSMISQNYSHDSKVWTKEYDLDGNLIRETGEKNHSGKYIYDGLEGYEYIDIEFDTFEWRKKATSKAVVKTKVGRKLCRWAQLPDGQKSIMPSILEELLKARKETRDMIKTETDVFMQNILDKRQLGYKVTANSLYGQCGSKTSTFYEQDVAASTTATGRMMITYAKRIIEEVYGDMLYVTKTHGEVQCNAEYVYGDSVASYTPVYVRKVGGDEGEPKINICKIEDLGEYYGCNGGWKPCRDEGKQDKEICEMADGVECWTENGWTRLYRVIRHVLAPHKKMMRILTHTGLVDVTDDHSLLRPDGTEVSPNDVVVGTELLHHPLPEYHPSAISQSCVSVEEARVMGFIFGDDTETIPTEILMGTQEIRQAFWDGIIDAFGGVTTEYIHIDQKNQMGASHIYWLANSLGWNSSINTTGDEDNIYRITFTENPEYNKRKNPHAIMKIVEIPQYEGFVYDLTTENHHFSAGIGQMVVHNTDSVFFTFNLKDPAKNGEAIIGKKALELTIEIAQDVAKLCTQFLKPPMELSYEKTLWPFCLLSKKRYFGKLFEYNPDKGKLKFMGLSLKRRDNCDLLKDVYGNILNILLLPELSLCEKINRCMLYLDGCLEQLIQGLVSMDKLSITKSLSGYYKNPEQIAHAVLAERIGNREAGNKPKPGDRIKFVHIFSNNKNALQGEKIETPEFIRRTGVKIDYSFYITNQLMKPLQQLFGLALEEILTLKGNRTAVNLYRKDIEILQKNYGGDLEEYAKKKEKYCSDKVKKLMFEKYLVQIKNQRDGCQQIDKYFKMK